MTSCHTVYQHTPVLWRCVISLCISYIHPDCSHVYSFLAPRSLIQKMCRPRRVPSSLSLSPHRFMFQQLHSTNLISSPLSESHGLCAGSRTFCMSPPDAYYYIDCLHNNQRCWIHFSASLCLRTSAHLEIGSPLGFRQLERALPHHHHSLFICGSCRALSVYPCSRVFQDNTAVNLAF